MHQARVGESTAVHPRRFPSYEVLLAGSSTPLFDICFVNDLSFPSLLLIDDSHPRSFAYKRHFAIIACTSLKADRGVFASYPQQKMRASEMSAGRRLWSQWTPFAAVQVLSRCPFNPWDGNNTGMKSDQALTTMRNNLLYDRPSSFRHHLEALEGCLNRLLGLRRFTSLIP